MTRAETDQIVHFTRRATYIPPTGNWAAATAITDGTNHTLMISENLQGETVVHLRQQGKPEILDYRYTMVGSG